MDAGFLCDRAGFSWPKHPIPPLQSKPGGHEWPPYESEQGEQQIADGGTKPIPTLRNELRRYNRAESLGLLPETAMKVSVRPGKASPKSKASEPGWRGRSAWMQGFFAIGLVFPGLSSRSHSHKANQVAINGHPTKVSKPNSRLPMAALSPSRHCAMNCAATTGQKA